MLQSILKLWKGAKVIDMYFQEKLLNIRSITHDFFVIAHLFARPKTCGCAHFAQSWDKRSLAKSKLTPSEAQFAYYNSSASLLRLSISEFFEQTHWGTSKHLTDEVVFSAAGNVWSTKPFSVLENTLILVFHD